jgi:hypothetical protein
MTKQMQDKKQRKKKKRGEPIQEQDKDVEAISATVT